MMGARYGLASGIIVPMVVFALSFTCMVVANNFVFALPGLLFNFIILLPLRKVSYRPVKYFSLSPGFMTIFSLVYILLMNTGMKIFLKIVQVCAAGLNKPIYLYKIQG